jgi:hypothetical protein
VYWGEERDKQLGLRTGAVLPPGTLAARSPFRGGRLGIGHIECRNGHTALPAVEATAES